ncbi:MAG: universal stress protein [Xanthomonadaceae bacterium]|nr:universal stress protein [Xanthomonadaceae bacterium]MEB2315462.1 universal stress protein [Xanthomonadaceae bacterium]
MSTAAPNPIPGTILLATDLSARCDRALDRAVQLARQWQARLVAVTVVDPGTLSETRVRAAPPPSWGGDDDGPAARTLRQLRRDAAATDVDIVVRVEEGRVNETLARVAVEEGAGLIVTGIARSESLGRTVLGSTVDWLARHATVPVLVVRDRTHGAYRNIVLASDFSPSARFALERAAGLFAGVPMTVFNAFEVPFLGMMDPKAQSAIAQGREAATREGQEFLASAALDPSPREAIRLHVEHGEPVRLTYEYARDHEADLIVLGTHGRSALFDILIGSIARRILETAATDILLVRNPAAAH